MLLFTLVVGDATTQPKCDILDGEQIEFMHRTFFLLKALYLPLFRKYGYEEDLDEAIKYWKTYKNLERNKDS